MQCIFAVDKVAKVRELRATLERGPSGASGPVVRERREHYERCSEMLDERLRGAPLVRQLRFAVWALRELPPAR